MVNLKSASLVVIMHLHKGLTHIQSQVKPWLLSGKSFTLSIGKKGYMDSHDFMQEKA